MQRKLVWLCVSILVAIAHRSLAQAPPAKADSLYFNSKWKEAKVVYEANLRANPRAFGAVPQFRLGICYQRLGDYDKASQHLHAAHELKPPPSLKPFVEARLAQNFALQGNGEKTFVWLDSAAKSGYAALNEIDTIKAYSQLRNDKRFDAIYKRVYNNAYPCASNPKQREFDFWVGEWDVYVTGTTSPKIGHSLVENVAGECLILENWTALGVIPNSGKSMNYYDTNSKTWEQVWMGSGGGLNRFINGKYQEDAMRFTFTQKSPTGQDIIGRFIFFNLGPDKVRQFQETSMDNGKTWQTVYDFTYIRRKS